MDDAIALFALGALDRDETRAVDEHAAGCSACSQLLAEAEAGVAAMSAVTVPLFEPPPELGARIAASARAARVRMQRTHPAAHNLWQYGTLAASFIALATGIFGATRIASEHATIASDDRALAAIAVSHFAHTTFDRSVPEAPVTKALWGKSPPWIYVIVDSPSCGCTIAGRTASGERDFGAPEARGRTATLFVPDGSGVTALELRAGTRVLSTVRHP